MTTKVAALNDLLQKDISRQEFIKYLGVGFLALIGVTSLLNNLSALHPSHNSKKVSHGYGDRAYGR